MNLCQAKSYLTVYLNFILFIFLLFRCFTCIISINRIKNVSYEVKHHNKHYDSKNIIRRKWLLFQFSQSSTENFVFQVVDKSSTKGLAERYQI